MRYTLVTLFPEWFESPLSAGLMGKAVENGIVSFRFANPRDKGAGRHRSVDDSPYGGGPGMVLMLDPLVKTLREIGDMAFFGCTRLGACDYEKSLDMLAGTGFLLPDGLEKIGSDAFSKCVSIAPVLYFPASLREIGHHAFFSCSGIKALYFAAADEQTLSLGEAWRPKNIKAGPLWKAPDPQFGKTRADGDALIEDYRAELLTRGREEAQKNG